MLGDPEGPIGERLEVRQVAVLVEDPGELGDLVGKPLARQSRRGALHPTASAPFEDALHGLRVFVLDV